ncbi:DUF1772 domain-containing protein [Luedemannella flava]|uniref:DUF1772 domain-containing protein n=1 Tax=Luedemannella flava TaxID=349316 RepID=A0ABP4Z834_9ACTN
MGTLRVVVLIAATVDMGLMAGVFVIYANAIMPGLRRVDDATFVRVFAALDRAILNPLFLAGGFLGALALAGLSAGLHLTADTRPVLPWLVAAFVLYLGAVVVTIAVNVPLNDGLKAAGPDADPEAVRAAFDETRWSRWNLARAVLTSAAFALLTWALVEYGRTA